MTGASSIPTRMPCRISSKGLFIRCMDDGFKLAIKAAGSASRLAALIGVSQQAVQQWRRIPAERVIEVERVTLVPREQLRPDLYLAPRPNRRRRRTNKEEK